MGSHNQTPNSQTRRPKTPPGSERHNPRSERAAHSKDKDAGNVPRSDDDVASESNQGTREDELGSNAHNG